VRAEVVAAGIAIRARATTTAATGVEMEAMTAAAVAALTVYAGIRAGIRRRPPPARLRPGWG